ncbi:4980_t:CDS:1 [Funneliformis geosporum]|uniref:4980_t:CDS:1 n=1 Tax=Funneliformis geosporum TaxID=1117311 RepID=A0A9W4WXJ6_9GLOM|nr:4980_t:CDS:1 [Funneliformis geosporum]
MKLHFFEPETSIKIEQRSKVQRKRKPNIFIEYRKLMKRYKPHKMPMTTYSKYIAKEWYNLSEDEKQKLRRNYHITRDTDEAQISESANLNPLTESDFVINEVSNLWERQHQFLYDQNFFDIADAYDPTAIDPKANIYLGYYNL